MKAFNGGDNFGCAGSLLANVITSYSIHYTKLYEIAVPGAFGIEQHRSLRPDEDVLRAHVAVHQRAPRRGSARGERLEPLGEPGMARRGCEQVRLETDCAKVRVGRKLRRYGGVVGSYNFV